MALRKLHLMQIERDEPQTVNGVNENESMNEGEEQITPQEGEEIAPQESEEEIEPPDCPYHTPIITIIVGSSRKQFTAHLGVLSQSAVLEPKCQASIPWNQQVDLLDVDASVFELALCHMYGRDYKEYFSPSNPRPNKTDTEAAAFKRHSLLYCFARKYQLNSLTKLATKNIKDLGQVEYQSVLVAAREAYKQFPDDESWFRDYFTEATKKALTECNDLLRKPWVLDAFREEKGDFTVDLFTALTEGCGNVLSRVSSTDSESETALKYSSKQSSTERTESDTASIPDLTTDEIVSEDAVFVKEHYCAGKRAEYPCIVEAVLEAKPTHPVEDVAEDEPGMSDDWMWSPWNFAGKGKRDKKKEKYRYVDEAPVEEVPADEVPADAPAEEAPAEEAPAEEAPTEALAYVPAEEAPTEALAYSPAEEAPAEETPAEETPAYAPTEEAPLTEVENDFWGFSSKKKKKKARFATEIDFSSPPPPSPPHDLSEPDNTPCRRRGYHLADEVRWMECPKCRAELSAIARNMTSTSGWRNFS